MSGLAELHLPVMLADVVALLAPALEAPPTDPAVEGGSVSGSYSRTADARSSPYLVDCTLGLGGHAHALLVACPEAQLIGLEDNLAMEAADAPITTSPHVNVKTSG